MHRLTRILALGAAAAPAFGFNLAPRMSTNKVTMKTETPNKAYALDLLKKAGVVMPTILLPFAGSFPSQAAIPRAESAVNQVIERGAATPVAGLFDSFGSGGFGSNQGRDNQGYGQTRGPTSKESFRLGIQELRKALNDPRELQEALNLLKDPQYRAEVQRLQNDPSFQREFRSLTQSREFQQAMQQARQQIKQLQNDPSALESLRNQLLRQGGI